MEVLNTISLIVSIIAGVAQIFASVFEIKTHHNNH